jgi:two-component system nitrogen regulation sensor histidine kinase NtrY
MKKDFTVMINKKQERITSRTAEEKRRRRERFIIVLSTVLIILMTSLMVYISGSSTFISLASNILVYGLINFNVILILLLIFLVVRNLIKLIFERKRKIFGYKLRTRLVVAFVGFSIVPTILLFVAAISYITKSTEMWLSSQIEQSLHESLKVAQLYYQNSANNAIFFARQISRNITEGGLLKKGNRNILLELLRKKQKEYNLSAVEIYSPDQIEISKVLSPQLPKESFVRPEYQLVMEGCKGKEISNIQSLGTGDLIRGVVPIYSSWNPKDIVGVVSGGFFIQKSLIGKMNKISKTFEEYRYLETRKTPIKLNYLIYLTLIALLITFSATWFGFYMAKQITVPIQALAEKTKDVAHGQLDVRIDQVASDEIGTLVDSFNRMTHDIKTSKEELERSNIDLQGANFESEQRRRYMEIVLRNVTAGVISIDKDNRITTINKSAERMLSIKIHQVLNKKYTEVLGSEHYALVTEIMQEMEDAKKESLERQVTLKLRDAFKTILANFTVLRDEKNDYMGIVVVFDDLTELQKAQRMIAWKEVARRIAHEIKNPLTPIQLSAQRLRRKYLNEFKENGTVFDECTGTIIDQVDTMRKLVNEFQNFARMPAANPVPNNINRIIEEVLTLYLGNHGKVLFHAGLSIPILALDKEQIKRAMINLIDNSLAAMDGGEGKINIKTSFRKRLKLVRIEIADDGHGISPEDKAKLFEPYFSRKKSGTGLGLTIVNTIISDHNGYIRVFDNEPRGTKFVIELPV